MRRTEPESQRMIENNPTNVSSAFEILLEEIEAEIEFVTGVGVVLCDRLRGVA